MKTPISAKIDPIILKEARDAARRENRSFNNFIEVSLKERIEKLNSINVK